MSIQGTGLSLFVFVHSFLSHQRMASFNGMLMLMVIKSCSSLMFIFFAFFFHFVFFCLSSIRALNQKRNTFGRSIGCLKQIYTQFFSLCTLSKSILFIFSLSLSHCQFLHNPNGNNNNNKYACIL